MTQRAQRAPRLFVLKRNDAKGAENAKVFIVVIEPQSRRDAGFLGSGIRDRKAVGRRKD